MKRIEVWIVDVHGTISVFESEYKAQAYFDKLTPEQKKYAKMWDM